MKWKKKKLDAERKGKKRKEGKKVWQVESLLITFFPLKFN